MPQTQEKGYTRLPNLSIINNVHQNISESISNLASHPIKLVILHRVTRLSKALAIHFPSLTLRQLLN